MIHVHNDGALTTITLNRVEKANALTSDMLADLAEAVVASDGQKALIITGAGKVFSAGADLDAAKAGLATSPLWEQLSTAIAEFRGISIAALNGTVAGGAFGMVLACDLRVSVSTANFFYPVARLGYLPQPSDPRRLCSLIGPSGAKRILVAGQKINAIEAHRLGLVDELAQSGDLMAQATDMVTPSLECDLAHLSAIKSMI